MYSGPGRSGKLCSSVQGVVVYGRHVEGGRYVERCYSADFYRDILFSLVESSPVSLDKVLRYVVGCLGSAISLSVVVPSHYIPEAGPRPDVRIISSTMYV